MDTKQTGPKSKTPSAAAIEDLLPDVMEVIQSMNGGIVNVKRYPPGSAVVKMALQRGMEALDRIFQREESFTIGESEKKLILNEVPLSEKVQKRGYVYSFLTNMLARNIRSFTFHRGMDLDEVLAMLDVIGDTPDALRKLGNVSDHLRSQGVTHISLDEKVFVTLKKEQTVVDQSELERLLASQGGAGADPLRIKQGIFAEYLLKKLNLGTLKISEQELASMGTAGYARLAERIAAAIEGEAGKAAKKELKPGEERPKGADDPFLREIFAKFETLSSSILHLKNEKVRRKLLLDLSRILLNFKESTLTKLMNARVPKSVSKLDLKALAISQASIEKHSHLTDQMLKKYTGLLEGISPEDFDVQAEDIKEGERVLGLLSKARSTGEAVPRSEAEKLQRAAAMVSALSKGATTKEGLVILKTNRLLGKPPSFFLNKEVIENLPELVSNILAINRPDIIKKLVARISENLASENPEEQEKALKALMSVAEALLDSPYFMLAGDTVSVLLKQAQHAKDPRNIEKMQQSLATFAGKLIRAKQSNALQNLIGSMEAARERGGRYAEFIRETMSLLGSDEAILEILMEEIGSENEAVSSVALIALIAMPPEATVPHCVRILAESKDMRVRKKCISALSKLGETVLTPLRKEMKADVPWYLIRNLILIATDAGLDAAADDVLRFIDHQDVRVRKAAYQSLMKMSGEKAKQALRDGLEDEDISVRRMIVLFLGTHRDKRASDDLLRMLGDKGLHHNTQYEALACDIINALGRIREPGALQPLLKIAGHGKILGLLKKRNEKMVVAAIRALGEIGDPKAEPVLRKLLKDASSGVSRSAREALVKLSG